MTTRTLSPTAEAAAAIKANINSENFGRPNAFANYGGTNYIQTRVNSRELPFVDATVRVRSRGKLDGGHINVIVDLGPYTFSDAARAFARAALYSTMLNVLEYSGYEYITYTLTMNDPERFACDECFARPHPNDYPRHSHYTECSKNGA